jgi:hypothetical protein
MLNQNKNNRKHDFPKKEKWNHEMKLAQLKRANQILSRV